MFERFDSRARRVIGLAQEEARLLNHNYIGTEHLLLGLLHGNDDVAAKALEDLGVSLGAARTQVEEIIGRGKETPIGHIPFTPRAKKVMELSLREALQLGHKYVGTEHLLLGIIREGQGVAAQIVVRLGVDLPRVREQVVQLLSRTPTWWRGDLEASQSFLTSMGIALDNPPVLRLAEPLSCTFCRRAQDQVSQLVAGPDVYICDECVGRCGEIIKEQRGR